MNPIDPLGKGRVEPSRANKSQPLAATTPSSASDGTRKSRFVDEVAAAPRAIERTERVAAIEVEIERSFGSVLPPDSMAAILAAVERHPAAQRLLDRAIAETRGPAPSPTPRSDDSLRHGDSP